VPVPSFVTQAQFFLFDKKEIRLLMKSREIESFLGDEGKARRKFS